MELGILLEWMTGVVSTRRRILVSNLASLFNETLFFYRFAEWELAWFQRRLEVVLAGSRSVVVVDASYNSLFSCWCTVPWRDFRPIKHSWWANNDMSVCGMRHSKGTPAAGIIPFSTTWSTLGIEKPLDSIFIRRGDIFAWWDWCNTVLIPCLSPRSEACTLLTDSTREVIECIDWALFQAVSYRSPDSFSSKTVPSISISQRVDWDILAETVTITANATASCLIVILVLVKLPLIKWAAGHWCWAITVHNWVFLGVHHRGDLLVSAVYSPIITSTLFISRLVEFAQLNTCSSLHVLGGSKLILLIPKASFALINLYAGVFQVIYSCAHVEHGFSWYCPITRVNRLGLMKVKLVDTISHLVIALLHFHFSPVFRHLMAVFSVGI